MVDIKNKIQEYLMRIDLSSGEKFQIIYEGKDEEDAATKIKKEKWLVVTNKNTSTYINGDSIESIIFLGIVE